MMSEVINRIKQEWGSKLQSVEEMEPLFTRIKLEKSQLFEFATYLANDLKFGHCSIVSAVDQPERDVIELFYHVTRYDDGSTLEIHTETGPRGERGNLPEIDSITPIWGSADWHEREQYDLMGVNFKGHPDLRRILLPHDWDDWEDEAPHPLRKDVDQLGQPVDLAKIPREGFEAMEREKSRRKFLWFGRPW